MVYFLHDEDIIIILKIDIVKILENSNPPNPLLPRKNFTSATFEKLINSELLLNLIPASTAQKIHTPIRIIIKQTNERCFLIGSTNEYENL
ncbi:MAG: hypothetical protein ACLRFE_01520 [Clostridia bacterium]